MTQLALWRPPCPCDTACLPAEECPAHPLVQLGRWAAAVGVLISAMLRPGRAPALAARMLAALGIRWSVVGAPIRTGALLAGNHVSFLDILVVMAFGGPQRVRIVAKAEVHRWPIIGRLARSCGTIFVDRAKPRTLPDTVALVTGALRKGYPVQVFPEGTTTCGAHPAPWRPAFMQAAIDAGAPVQRFTLLFNTTAAAFVQDETLLNAIRRVIAARDLSVTVLIEEPVTLQGDRRNLARALQPKVDRLGRSRGSPPSPLPSFS